MSEGNQNKRRSGSGPPKKRKFSGGSSMSGDMQQQQPAGEEDGGCEEAAQVLASLAASFSPQSQKRKKGDRSKDKERTKCTSKDGSRKKDRKQRRQASSTASDSASETANGLDRKKVAKRRKSQVGTDGAAKSNAQAETKEAPPFSLDGLRDGIQGKAPFHVTIPPAAAQGGENPGTMNFGAEELLKTIAAIQSSNIAQPTPVVHQQKSPLDSLLEQLLSLQNAGTNTQRIPTMVTSPPQPPAAAAVPVPALGRPNPNSSSSIEEILAKLFPSAKQTAQAPQAQQPVQSQQWAVTSGQSTDQRADSQSDMLLRLINQGSKPDKHSATTSSALESLLGQLAQPTKPEPPKQQEGDQFISMLQGLLGQLVPSQQPSQPPPAARPTANNSVTNQQLLDMLLGKKPHAERPPPPQVTQLDQLLAQLTAQSSAKPPAQPQPRPQERESQQSLDLLQQLQSLLGGNRQQTPPPPQPVVQQQPLVRPAAAQVIRPAQQPSLQDQLLELIRRSQRGQP